MLTEGQVQYFETFGFIVLRQRFSAGEMVGISRDFDDVMEEASQGAEFSGDERQIVVGFIERRPLLSGLVEDDRIYGPLEQLLDPGFIWVASDGNLYVGDTNWHSDKRPAPGYKQVKVTVYLDPVQGDTGCLRVVPGSHRQPFHDDLRKHLLDENRRPMVDATDRSKNPFGVFGSELPCFQLESQPGDVVFFRQEILHASFGGRAGRRMFARGIFDRPKEQEQIDSVTALYKHHRSDSDDATAAAFFNSDRPRIKSMIAGLREMGIE